MKYLEQIGKCRTLDELFSVWSKKEEVVQRVVYSGKTHYLKIDYKENGFISDGIINQEVWDKIDFPKVLFVLKYMDYQDVVGDWDIRSSVKGGGYLGDNLTAIYSWAAGLLLTSEKKIRPYMGAHVERCLEKIAVLFLKKENTENEKNLVTLTLLIYIRRITEWKSQRR